MKELIVKFTHIELPDYELGDAPILEKMLSKKNSLSYTYEAIGLIYDADKKLLRIPRAMDVSYLAKITNRTPVVETKPTPAKRIKMRLLAEPRDNPQRQTIAFMIGENKYAYTKMQNQLSINLRPRMGKTYVAIAGSTFIGKRVIVITYLNKLLKQWYDSYLQFTDTTEDEIMILDSSKTIEKVLTEPKSANKRRDWKYARERTKVILVNHSTLHSYGTRNGYDAITKLFEELQIGLTIYDEAHMHFDDILKVDFFTNVSKTIYLTATFRRTDREEARVFKEVFKFVPKLNMDSLDEKPEKQFNVLVTSYKTSPTLQQLASMKNFYGFNKAAYAKYSIEQPEFTDALFKLVGKIRQLGDEQILILCELIDNADTIYEELTNLYPELDVGIYHSKLDSSIDKDNELTKDIIVSTGKSMGTGVDIKRLRFVINCEATGSTVAAEQFSGRLGNISDKVSLYAELYDRGVPKLIEYARKKKTLFKKIALKILKLDF